MLDLTVLLAKAETVYGTAVVLAGATDALQAFGYSVTPIQAEQVRRAIDVPYAGRRPSKKTGVHAAHNFSVELCGAGTATGVPFWAKLLRGCMFAVPTVGASSVTIPLDTTGDGGSLSLSGWKDTVKHPAKGARGNAKFVFTEKALPRIELSYLALIDGSVPALAAAQPAITLPTIATGGPVEVNLANTVVTLDGYTLGVRSLEIDMGMKTVLYSTTGSRAILFDKADDGDRRSAGGTAVFELPDPSVKEYFTAAINGTPLAFALTHGLVAGNIIGMTSPGFVITDITYSVENNRLFGNATFDLVPTAANNELVLITS